jgi:hypothetical protein
VRPALSQAVDASLRRVCSQLLLGAPGPKPEAGSEAAVSAAAIAYLRSSVAAPRDMSAAAAEQLRIACDAVLQETF